MGTVVYRYFYVFKKTAVPGHGNCCLQMFLCFQKDCCAWAWELLVDRVGMDKERLYVTYFGGNEKFGLEPDNETRDIWINLG